MTVTLKDPSIMLNPNEQVELRKFMKNPSALIPVSINGNPLRKLLIESLESKGYILKEGSSSGYDFYILKSE